MNPQLPAVSGMESLFDQLGLQVLERGWLSSNNVVFRSGRRAPAAVVDSGHVNHTAQTLALVRRALAGDAPGLLVNTHLHSDHCGGNAGMQKEWALRTRVPLASFDAVRTWNDARLSYRATGQRCARFSADAPLAPGDTIALGEASWQVLAAPGHDPEALMLFEPDSRVLISGDALWESRLAIIFPELDGRDGFGPTAATLDAIAALKPAVVIPGHGAPFDDVDAALQASRQRLAAFAADGRRHDGYAARALAMYRVLERGGGDRDTLAEAIAAAPMMQRMIASSSAASGRAWAETVLERLLQDGLLRIDDQGRLVAA